MEKRPAFKLKYLLLVYNAFQVGLSAYMFYEFFASAFLARYNLSCQPVDTSMDPLALRVRLENIEIGFLPISFPLSVLPYWIIHS